MHTRPLRLRLLLLAAPLLAAAAEPRPATDAWFVFAPANTTEPGALGMAHWLDAPAGRHGPVRARGAALVFEDGTPARFWGTNHGNGRTAAPEPDEARRRAAWYAKWGVNAVRFHNFAPVGPNGLGDPRHAARLDPELLDRMDHYASRLAAAGIYTVWSPLWGLVPGSEDRPRLLAYDEIVGGDAERPLDRSTYGVVNLFEDLQALHVELFVNLLEHRNPYTGLRYADDPALAMIQLQNEDNAFWSAGRRLERMPTYKAELARRFSAWLRARYGSHEALVRAWGPHGVDLWPELSRGEHLDRANLYPPPDRRFYQPDAFARSKAPRRLADSAEFLYELQDRYYQRLAAAIRATGYRGVVVGSCWKADDGVPHFYNLLADARVGPIDRHTYYGGQRGKGHWLEAGAPLKTVGSMLGRPDLGLLGAGLAQVVGRPFGLSEWTGKSPNEWIAEGPPVVAYYGLGLQGWDFSFHFSSRAAGFSDRIEARGTRRHVVYNTNHPTQIGLFPLLARAVLRGDVREGAPVEPARRVSLTDLRAGRVPFEERSATGGDVNVRTGTVPALALGVGRVEVELPDLLEPTPAPAEPPLVAPDLGRWVEGTRVRSNTGELVRDRAGGGRFTVDTANTKAVVGFAAGQAHALGAITLAPETPFAVVVLTNRERKGTLADSEAALLAAVARARNSGQRYSDDGGVLEAVGDAPVRLEPVRVRIRWDRLAGATLEALDHDGLRTGRVRRLEEPELELDTGRDATPFYELRFPAAAPAPPRSGKDFPRTGKTASSDGPLAPAPAAGAGPTSR